MNHGLSGGEKPARGGRCNGRSGHGEVRPGLRFQCHLQVADVPGTPGPHLRKAQHRLYVGLLQALSKKTNAEASNRCLAPGGPWMMFVPFPLSLGGEPCMWIASLFFYLNVVWIWFYSASSSSKRLEYIIGYLMAHQAMRPLLNSSVVPRLWRCE